MAFLGRFLLPIRISLSSLSSLPKPCLSTSTNTLIAKYIHLKTSVRALDPAVKVHLSKCQLSLNMQRKWVHNLNSTGRKIGVGSSFALPVLIGTMELNPTVAYAVDDNEILAEEHHPDFWDAFGCVEDDDPRAFWAWARKYWLPVLLVLTVVMGWEHPLTLAIKVALFLFSTKPSPLSVYLFIEQLRRRSMCQDPGIYKLKAFYAKKVEVEDYKLLCLARVELREKKITLMGILGNWWILQSSS